MSKKLSFIELAKKILLENQKPMTPIEIWEDAVKKNYELQVATKGKTPWRSIGAQIYVHVRDNTNSPFIKINSKPKKFYLKDLITDQTYIENEEKIIEEPEYSPFHERDLHPFLTYFVNTFLNIHTYTIFHEKSIKKSYAQWLHPDLVGVNFPIEDWNSEVLDFGILVGGQVVKLYSFEIKKELTFSNLREAFFQTVSNSSWANEGYLVAAKISTDEEFLTELKRLTTSFGIGIIKLDIDDPDSSSIIFPAKFKSELDWDTINKISTQNPDFNLFLARVKKDLSIKEIIKSKYDRVNTLENLLKRKKS